MTTQYRPPHAVVVGIIVVLLILLGVMAAMADDTVYVYPRIPSEEEKVSVLKLAYILAGGSFSGGPMLDLSKPFMPEPPAVRTIPIEPNRKRNR